MQPNDVFTSIPDIWRAYPHLACKYGIVHVGAHRCEEKKYYDEWNMSNVMWIDGNDELCAEYPNIVNAIVSDRDNEEVDFILTNNDAMSSSILELNEHMVEHPDCLESKRVRKKTITLDTLLEQKNETGKYDMLVMDVQGAELLVLKGGQRMLENVRTIITEVNTKELYTGCAQLGELDAYLLENGFVRIHTQMTRHGWGDAIYLRRAITVQINSGFGNRLFQLAFLYALAKQTKSIAVLVENLIDVCAKHTTTKNKYISFYSNFECYSAIPGRQEIIYEDIKAPCLYVDYTERVRQTNVAFIHFRGFFQSRRYFDLYESEIKTMFMNALMALKASKPSKPLKPLNVWTKFVHVRGRDHISVSNISHRLPYIEGYYERALIAGNCTPDNTIVITDDANYVRTMKVFTGFQMFDFTVDELDAMRCMVGCKSVAVTTNSTFSWWGAFLAESQQTFMPYPYILDDCQYKDIYFSGVTKVDVFLIEVFDCITSCRQSKNRITMILCRKGRQQHRQQHMPWIQGDILINGIKVDSVKLFNAEDYGADSNMYNDMFVIETFIKKNKNPSETIKVTINGYSRDIPVTQETDSSAASATLVAMTLFRGDEFFINAYVNHHRQLGVERFYLYYNGETLPSSLPKLEGVIYCTWPYDYMVENMHYAQLGAMTDMLYRAKHFAEYVLFNDLDEFVVWNSKTPLREFIVCNKSDVYGFLNNFVLLNDTMIDTFIERKAYTKSYALPFGRRSKCIVRSSALSIMGVHKPMNMDNLDVCVLAPPMCELLHICNAPGRNNYSISEKTIRESLSLASVVNTL